MQGSSEHLLLEDAINTMISCAGLFSCARAKR